MSIMPTRDQLDQQRQFEAQFGVNPTPSRAGLFGNRKGLFGGGVMPEKGAQAPAPRRGGIGGFLQRNQNTLAMAGDIISRAGGGSGNPVLAQLQQQQLMDYRTQAQKQQQDAEQQQWLMRQQWERANPGPVEPTAMQRNYEWLNQNHPNVAADYLAAQARDPNDELVNVTIPNVGTYVGPRSGMGQAFGMGGGQRGGNRPAIGATIQLGGGTPAPGPQMNTSSGPTSGPQMTVTPRELDALVRRFGPQEVQRRLDSGIVAVREN